MKTKVSLLREMGREFPLTDSRPLERTEVELDPPCEGELLIRVRAAGLCHSDLSVITGKRPRVMPMALGHEAAGEVMAAGSADSEFQVGDHVVLAFVPACGECGFCQAGRPALCEAGAAANNEGALLGGHRRMMHEEGAVHHHLGVSGFSDHIVVSEKSAVTVPDDLPFDIAALFGCAVLTGAGAVFNTAAEALPAESVGIFGLGGVGLSALIAAEAQGASRIVAVDRVPAKLDLALELGATDVVIAGEDDVASRVRAASGGGVDLAVETVGHEAVLAEAYSATARGGMTVSAGLPHPDATLELPALSLIAEERTLKGSYLGSCVPSRDIPRFIRMYEAGELPVDRLLDQRLTPDQLNEGFDRLASGEAIRQIVMF